MTKKDIILVAVLVNMVLLVFLFIGAIKTPQPSDVVQEWGEPKSLSMEKVTQKTAVDQVDQLLSQYIVTQESTKKEPDLPSLVNVPTEQCVSSCSDLVEIEVRTGDTLDALARAHKTNVSEIKRLNQLQDDIVHLGQILYLPKKVTSVLDTTEQTITTADEKYYTVKAGDNPWTIAKKNNMKVGDLLRINGLNEQKATKLQPGDRLRIE